MKTNDRNKNQDIERVTRTEQRDNIKRKKVTSIERNKETMKIVRIMLAKPKD